MVAEHGGGGGGGGGDVMERGDSIGIDIEVIVCDFWWRWRLICGGDPVEVRPDLFSRQI
jgi:hypothetical protein